MKTWSLYLVAYSVASQYQAFASKTHDYSFQQTHSSICSLSDLTLQEAIVLEHFNGIFGKFSIVNDDKNVRETSMFGPIAAYHIQSKRYSYNTYNYNSNSSGSAASCPAIYNTRLSRFSRFGLLSNSADVELAKIQGAYWTEYGSVSLEERETESNMTTRRCTVSTASNDQGVSNDDAWEELWSFTPRVLRGLSRILASFKPDTSLQISGKRLVLMNSQKTIEGYRIIKLPACSDQGCEIVGKKETTADILQGGEGWTGYVAGTQGNETVVVNIPVFVGNTYTISALDVNKIISPCHAIFNFYPVNLAGEYVEDPEATFTVSRAPNVTIAGIILAPQAHIVDPVTGYFGGQLLTLQTYEGKGADIKNFHAASNGRCVSHSLCLTETTETEDPTSDYGINSYTTKDIEPQRRTKSDQRKTSYINKTRGVYNSEQGRDNLSGRKKVHDNLNHRFRGGATNMIITPTDI